MNTDYAVALYLESFTKEPGVAFMLGVLAAAGPEAGRELAEEIDRRCNEQQQVSGKN